MRRSSLLAAVALTCLAPAAVAQTTTTIRANINYFGLFFPESALGFYSERSFDEVRVVHSARSMAMGGTRLAVDNDPSALAENPAALSRISGTQWLADGFTTTGGGTSSGLPKELVTEFGPLPIASMQQKPAPKTTYGFLGAAHPLEVSGRDVVVGFGYGRFLNTTNPLESTVEFTVQGGTTGQSASTTYADVRDETGGVDAVAPSVSVSLAPGVSVGATANFLTGLIRTDIRQTVTILGLNLGVGEGTVEQKYGGFAMTFGGLADFGRVSIGATVTPRYSLESRSGRYHYRQIQTDPSQPTPPLYEGDIRDYDLQIPLFAGGGIAVRPFERLLLAADYYYRPWSDARLKYVGDPSDAVLLRETILPWNAGDDFWGEINGLNDVHEALRDPLLQDANSFHVGAEYELLHRHMLGVAYTMPVRVGFHTNPQTFRGVDPSDTLAVGQDGDGLYRDKQVKGTAITGGFGLTMEQVSFDFSFRHSSEEFTSWFYVNNTSVATPNIKRVGSVRLKETLTELRLTTTLRF
jgi:hypothetical protein